MSDAFKILIRQRKLILAMAKRELSDKYVGQVLGMFWTIGHPLVLMMIYLFIFAFVFRVNVSDLPNASFDYTVYLLSGLIPWLAIQDCLAKSALAITANANLVKQVVFPIEVLPIKGVLVSMLPQVVSTVLLAVYTLIKFHFLPWTYVLLPAVLLFQVLGLVGVAYVLSAIGVYLRDLKDIVQVFCTAGLYLIPVFYLPNMIPEMFRPVLYINPFSYVIWCYQDIFFFGRFEHSIAWAAYPCLSLIIFIAGDRMFSRLKSMFGNHL